MRTTSDFGSWGNTTAFRDAPPAGGSERETKDSWDKALSFLGGFFTQWGVAAEGAATNALLAVAFGPGYFAVQGISFWTGVIDTGAEGYRYDGALGAAASVLNLVNPLEHAGTSLVDILAAAEHGDYAGMGAASFALAGQVAQMAVLGVVGGTKRAGRAYRAIGNTRQ